MSTPVTSADSGQNLDRDEMIQRVEHETFAAFGENFEPAYSYATTHERVQRILGSSRRDNPPEAINPWECRIGGSKFFIPPININVSSVFKSGSMTGAAIRQQSAPKFNSGHTETVIDMTIYFSSYEEIFGFEDEIFRINFDNAEAELDLSQYHPSDRRLFSLAPAANSDDQSIDKFLSSLRGLIAQFKYAPFLPVRNAYLNRSFGITGVVLKDMTISTVPDYPFCLVVNLTMYKFNHKVYLPMIDHFDQAIHWGRFRQYMGRAAGRLAQSARPIKEFAFVDTPEPQQVRPTVRSASEILNETRVPDVPAIQTYTRHSSFDSNRIEFWYPISTPAAVELPDISDMRYDDIVFNQQRKNWWQRFLGVMGFDVNTDPDRYRRAREMAEERGTGFIVNQNEFSIFTAYLNRVRLALNLMNNRELNKYYEDRLRQEGIAPGSAQAEELRIRTENVWFHAMYRFFMEDPTFARALASQDRRGRQLSINEWEVPMVPRDLDMDTIKIQGISVTLGNVIARLQLQMQDEPTHQHIGGADTLLSVSMIIQGENAETELVKLRTMFEHISGLARLEHAHGVLGFLGIKNIITELVGMRYVMPLNFEVNTVPNYPHVYEATLVMTDFDIFQQKREQLSAEQQAELVESFGKRNPFFRIKQLWGMFNAYPDFPLSVRDVRGKVVGHLDPDYYFRSFKSLDEDIFLSEESQKFANLEPSSGADEIRRAIQEIDREAREDAQRKTSPAHNFLDGVGVHHCLGMGAGGTREYCTIDDSGFSLHSNEEPFLINGRFNEPHAGNVLTEPELEGMTPASGYMQPYLDSSGDPWFQFEAMTQDMLYRDNTGRMIRAYPSYMLWLIDEAGPLGSFKLFDNFYGLQSVIDMSIVQSEDILGDTLVLRVSNLYSKLSTKMNDMLDEDNPGARMINQMTTWLHRRQSQGNYIIDLETMQLRPGIRVHLRLGYGSNPNVLDTVFNGTITEVHTGEIVTIVAQSDAMELSALVESSNEKGHSGKIDGGMTGLYMSEPRDLMISLLTQGSSKVKEFVAHATQGEVFSENRFGIRHFGTMFYQVLDGREAARLESHGNRISAIVTEANERRLARGQEEDDTETVPVEELISPIRSDDNPLGSSSAVNIKTAPGLISLPMSDIMTAAWANLGAKRDYEVFKRNIYPGNGTGIGQFHGGDVEDFGLSEAINSTGSMKVATSGQVAFEVGGGGQAAINAAINVQMQGSMSLEDEATYWAENPNATEAGFIRPALVGRNRAGSPRRHNIARILGIRDKVDEGDVPGGRKGSFDEVAFRAQTYMKTVWDLFQVCAALLPDYIVAVRPFEDRSTVFYGKPHWLYTSGLIPLTTGLAPLESVPIESPDEELIEIFDSIEEMLAENENLSAFEQMFSSVERYQPNMQDPYNSLTGISFRGDASGANLAARAALAAGFPPDEAITMVAIAGAESNWKAGINNAGMNRDGTTDYGMWQINRGAHGGWVDFNRIYEPFYNAQIAYELVQRKKRRNNPRIFGDWAVHDHYSVPNAARGKYRQYLEPARIAVEQELRNASGRLDPLVRGDETLVPPVVPTDSSGQEVLVDPGQLRESNTWRIAAEVYNFNEQGRDLDEAKEIWDEIKEHFPTDGETERIFMRSRQLANLSGPRRQAVFDQVFEDVVASYIGFMYENPYARGWVVRTTNRRAGGSIVRGIDRWIARVVDSAFNVFDRDSNLTEGAEERSNRNWVYDHFNQCFSVYISHGDAAAIEYMKNNYDMGRDQSNLILRAFESTVAALIRGYKSTKDTVLAPFKAVGGLATGLIGWMQMHMAQISHGMSLATDIQRQTNQLNRAFNDSLYYHAGRDEDGRIINPMLYYADNPFTREYAEPVVEIREPFQRLHTLGSFQDILDNGVIQKTTDVATVVTATSNGQHPVTVHFDKGAPADRQVEKVVDTGLFYDHPKGWLGTKRLFKPVEWARQVSMFTNGTNMETTAKRVALTHLKQSLQDIYDGYITVVGNSKIRTHDLVFLGDVYERMYGLFEVEEVVHHFTPETGFITMIKPNACVSINDPARFMLHSQFRGRGQINEFRRRMRKRLKVYADEASEGELGSLMPDMSTMTLDEVVASAEVEVGNSLQYTGGASAIVKSIAGMMGIGGIVAGAATLSPAFGAMGMVAGWKAWGWVRDNLLDQQGCYISYMTQNGRPMDAGLSYNAGVAVGQQNVRRLVFKGLRLGEIPVLGPGGSPTIQTQEVVPLLRWDETGPNEHAQAISLFVDKTNAEVRRLAGHEGLPGGFDTEVYWAKITRVVDGDTFYIRVLGQIKYGEFSGGSFVLGNGRVRPAGVDAPEDDFKNRAMSERTSVYANDPGVRATEFARSILMPGGNGLDVALRIDRLNRTDQFGRTLAYVFHRAPEGLTGDDRRDFILNAAARMPPISYDSYMQDGQPYTFDWEMIAAGHGKVFTNDMKRNQFNQGVTGGG